MFTFEHLRRITLTHFHGLWDVVSPEPWCSGSGQNTDQTWSVPVSCEVGDGSDNKGRPATAAVATAVRPELHLAGGQHQIWGLMSETVCRRQHSSKLVLTHTAACRTVIMSSWTGFDVRTCEASRSRTQDTLRKGFLHEMACSSPTSL